MYRRTVFFFLGKKNRLIRVATTNEMEIAGFSNEIDTDRLEYNGPENRRMERVKIVEPLINV